MRTEDWKAVTVAVILFEILFPFVYTLLVGRLVGVEATISAVISEAGRQYPIIAAFFGALFALLIAHFWPIAPGR